MSLPRVVVQQIVQPAARQLLGDADVHASAAKFLNHRLSPRDVTIGDHVYVWRIGFLYSHHGIVVYKGGPQSGEPLIVHFSGYQQPYRIVVSTLSAFCGKNGAAHLCRYSSGLVEAGLKRAGSCSSKHADPVWVTVLRALCFIQLPGTDSSGSESTGHAGEIKYDMLLRNCELFARYCKLGAVQCGTDFRIEQGFSPQSEPSRIMQVLLIGLSPAALALSPAGASIGTGVQTLLQGTSLLSSSSAAAATSSAAAASASASAAATTAVSASGASAAAAGASSAAAAGAATSAAAPSAVTGLSASVSAVSAAGQTAAAELLGSKIFCATASSLLAEGAKRMFVGQTDASAPGPGPTGSDNQIHMSRAAAAGGGGPYLDSNNVHLSLGVPPMQNTPTLPPSATSRVQEGSIYGTVPRDPVNRAAQGSNSADDASTDDDFLKGIGTDSARELLVDVIRVALQSSGVAIPQELLDKLRTRDGAIQPCVFCEMLVAALDAVEKKQSDMGDELEEDELRLFVVQKIIAICTREL